MGTLKSFCALTLCLSFTHLTAAEDWPKYRHDLGNSGHSSDTQFLSANLSSLKLKWSFNTGGAVTASPAVATVNGTSMVFIGGWNGWFYALNAVTGQQMWDFEVDLVGPCTINNCRIASSPDVTNGIVYFGAENAYLYALNAATGALVWKQQLANPNNGYEIWSSPAVSNGNVYVGLASHGDNPCVVGQVVARNASTGAAVWNFSTVDETTCSGGTNCVGAGVWSSPALDTGNGIVYIGTGNPGSTCSPATGNATKYPDSILALSMSSGQLLNYYQAITNDNLDDDFGSSPVLYVNSVYNTCTGITTYTDYVAEASKNGSLYTLQINSGGLITSTATSTKLDGNGFVASPALLSHAFEQPCNVKLGKEIITRQGQLFLPSGNGNGGYLYRTGVLGLGQASIAVSPPNAIYSAPAMPRDIDTVLFGSTDNNLYAAATGLSQGMAVVWSYHVGSNVDSGPAISNGRLYFGASDGYLRCLSVNGQ
jgi:outer membrane protein assembly factor BamB